MKCNICKAEYNQNLPNCPFCSAINTEAPANNKKLCQSCHQPIELDDRFCGHCGVPQVDDKPKICSGCGEQLKADASFCTKCGTAVSQASISTVTLSGDQKFKVEILDDNDPIDVKPGIRPEIISDSSLIADNDSIRRISSTQELKTSAPPGLDPPSQPTKHNQKLVEPAPVLNMPKPPSSKKTPQQQPVVPSHTPTAKSPPPAAAPAAPATATPKSPPPAAAPIKTVASQADFSKPSMIREILLPEKKATPPTAKPDLNSLPTRQSITPVAVGSPTSAIPPVNQANNLADTRATDMAKKPAVPNIVSKPVQNLTPPIGAQPNKQPITPAAVGSPTPVIPPVNQANNLADAWAPDIAEKTAAPIVISMPAPEVAPPIIKNYQQSIPPQSRDFDGAENTAARPTISPTPVPVTEYNARNITKKRRWPFFLLLFVLILIIATGIMLWFRLFQLPSSLQSAPNIVDNSSADSSTTVLPATTSEEVLEANPEKTTEASQEDFSTLVKNNYRVVPIASPTWNNALPFDETGTAIVELSKKWGIINISGDYLVEPIYDSISNYSEGFSAVSKDDKFGYIDRTGNIIIPLEYDSASDFSEGFGLVSKDSYYYYINFSGKLLDLGGNLSTPFSSGCATIITTEGAHFVDADNNVLSETYEDAGRFSLGLAPVRENGKWGYLDDNFEVAIGFQFDEASVFEDGYAIVKKDKFKFLIDTTGKQVSPNVDEIWLPQENISIVKLGELYGYIAPSSSKDYLIEPQYASVYAFSESKAAVSVNGSTWHYIGTDNNKIFRDNSFEEAYMFVDNLACVKADDKYTMINETGNFAFENRWDQIGDFSNKILPVYEDGKWGYVALLLEG